MGKEDLYFKCANDLTLSVKKSDGEVIIDEQGCTVVTLLLKNSGELATSFFGAHNPTIIKNLEKSIKSYFKSIKKQIKHQPLDPSEDIQVHTEDIPADKKWDQDSKLEDKKEIVTDDHNNNIGTKPVKKQTKNNTQKTNQTKSTSKKNNTKSTGKKINAKSKSVTKK